MTFLLETPLVDPAQGWTVLSLLSAVLVWGMGKGFPSLLSHWKEQQALDRASHEEATREHTAAIKESNAEMRKLSDVISRFMADTMSGRDLAVAKVIGHIDARFGPRPKEPT